MPTSSLIWWLLQILTWLGYSNSCFNPVIYSIFNSEFRGAFHRILTSKLSPCCKESKLLCPNCHLISCCRRCGYQAVALIQRRWVKVKISSSLISYSKWKEGESTSCYFHFLPSFLLFLIINLLLQFNPIPFLSLIRKREMLFSVTSFRRSDPEVSSLHQMNGICTFRDTTPRSSGEGTNTRCTTPREIRCGSGGSFGEKVSAI